MSDAARSVQELQIEKNRREYGARLDELVFPTSDEAMRAMARRAALLAELDGRALTGANGTKLDCRNLSPGCRACMEGTWSCLFITGECNARCFYCPTPQDAPGVPGTNNLDFPRVDDYVDYLDRFGFTGASLSGGEPLLELERSLLFLRKIRDRLGDRVTLWLYTNGLLLTGEVARRLRDAGLDELRLDLGATGYRLDAVRLAVGVIPRVTVEIPAVPEEAQRLPGMLEDLDGLGVNHLNLHQLRLTRYNFGHLSMRGYTFLHGESVTVLESELTALALVRHGLDRGLALGVNYCSFVYKNRFQGAAARRRAATRIARSHEDVTEAGYLRALSLHGDGAELERQVGRLRAADPAGGRWRRSDDGRQLDLCAALCRAALCERPPAPGLELRIHYSEARILPSVSYRNPFVELALNPGRKVVIERQEAAPALVLDAARWPQVGAVLASDGAPPFPSGEATTLQAELLRFERIPSGLQEYF